MRKGIARIVIGIILIVLQLMSLIGNMKAGVGFQLSFASPAAFLFDLIFLISYFLVGIIGVILLVFVNKKSHLHPYILVVECDCQETEDKVKSILKPHVDRCVVKSKAAQAGSVELNLEVQLKEDNTDFVTALSKLKGVRKAVLVSYNGEYMG